MNLEFELDEVTCSDLSFTLNPRNRDRWFSGRSTLLLEERGRSNLHGDLKSF
jgi:hypothetical protein